MKIGNLDIKNIYLGELPVTSMFLGNLPIPTEGGGDWKFIGLDNSLEEATGSNITCYGVVQYKGSDTEITLPSEYKDLPVVAIYNNTFAEENEITSIYIPSSYKYLEDNVFEEMSHLTFANIPYSVEYIGSYLFDGCTNLINVSLDSGITYLSNGMFSGCSSLTSITLPNTLESIGEWCFNQCTSLDNVVIPNSVTDIGEAAFSGCDALYNIHLSNNVRMLNSNLFQSCDLLTTVNIPEGIEEIGSRAFVLCSNLTNIIIPQSLIGLGRDAFSSPGANKNVYYNGTIDEWCNIYCYYISGNPLYRDTGVTGDGNLYIYNPNGNVIIGDKRYSLVTDLTLPSTMVTCDTAHFSYCKSIERLSVPSNVKYLDYMAFRYCSNLRVVDIEEGLLKIGAPEKVYSTTSVGYTFGNCTNLEKIVLPVSLTYVGGYCFQNTSKVRVYYKGNATQWNTLKSSIYTGNTYITNKTPYYYSEEEPQSSPSSYWHYVDGEPTVWS